VLRPEDAAVELASHLERCASCRELLEAERSAWDSLEALDVPPLRRDLWAGVAARIEAAPVPSRPWRTTALLWLATPARHAATLVLVALLGLAVGGWVGAELLGAGRVQAGGVLGEALTDAFSVAPQGSLAAGLEGVGQ
jgi:hypothetical protein